MNSEIVAQAPAGPVSLLTIYLAFARLGMLSFGGGISSWVYREAVQIRGWMDDQEFAAGLALSQLLPGTNVGNLSVYVGMRLRGFPGACAALLGLLTVPFFAVLLALWGYDMIADPSWLNPVLDGITAAALGLLLLTGFRTSVRARGDVLAWAVIASTFGMIGVLQWPLLPVTLGMATISVLLAWVRRRRRA